MLKVRKIIQNKNLYKNDKLMLAIRVTRIRFMR